MLSTVKMLVETNAFDSAAVWSADWRVAALCRMPVKRVDVAVSATDGEETATDAVTMTEPALTVTVTSFGWTLSPALLAMVVAMRVFALSS